MQCTSTKPDGTRCLKEAPPNKDVCVMHDPAGAERRRRYAQKGGYVKALGSSPLSQELAQVRAELHDLITELKDKTLTPAIGAVVIQGLNAKLRALEAERKVLIEDQVEQRVKDLEERLIA